MTEQNIIRENLRELGTLKDNLRAWEGLGKQRKLRRS